MRRRPPQPTFPLHRGPSISFTRSAALAANQAKDGWAPTRDLARFDDEGWRTITERIKSLIKGEGRQASPADLQQVPAPDDKVADGAVLLAGPRPRSPIAGSTVFISGGGRGLGRVFAHAMSAAGAKVVITGRDVQTLRRAARELGDQGSQVLAIPADVTDADAVQNAVEKAEAEFGPIDVLVNNAGIGGPLGPTWTTDAQRWRSALEVNLLGTLTLCRSVLPGMTKRRSGRIINISSSAGRQRWPHASAYSVSKAAIDKLTENLAQELRGYAVSIFSYHPGLLDLGLTRDNIRRGPEDEPWSTRIEAWLDAERKAGHLTPPEKAAGTLLLLADGTADPLTGRYLTVDDDIVSLARQALSRAGAQKDAGVTDING